jgi:hypothetical protein
MSHKNIFVCEKSHRKQQTKTFFYISGETFDNDAEEKQIFHQITCYNGTFLAANVNFTCSRIVNAGNYPTHAENCVGGRRKKKLFEVVDVLCG